MTFYKKKKRFHPYDEAILQVFANTDKIVTPGEVADYLGIPPATVKRRILKLMRKRYISCKLEGKRLYCQKGSKEIEI
ncbi:MAG: helix-turn-helix domain-containing protein [Nanoarchaeota archaeon]